MFNVFGWQEPPAEDTKSDEQYVASIDQGTSSTRCIIFDKSGSIVSNKQLEHEQFYPQPGWVEHDADQIWENVKACVTNALLDAGLESSDLATVGITNQRESTLIWDKETGTPLHRLIVWNDTRSEGICRGLKVIGGVDRFRERTGLPISPYFSATKILWLMQNVEGVRDALEEGNAIIGTMDTWLVWKLTGGKMHITDVTNASRTLLMSLRGLKWDEGILDELGIPGYALPQIVSSSEVYAAIDNAEGFLNGVLIAGILGDQQAALFGQTCFEPGQAKCTYGTGSFIVMNTGNEVVPSTHGLLSTVGFKLGDKPCVYALEGSIAYAGSTVQWLRDNLSMISSAPEIEELAASVSDNGGVFFVPAFAGLLAPYWRSDARGLLCGLTAYNTKAHIARAVLEGTAYQVQEVLRAMASDSRVDLSSLRVDGGMTANDLLMQFQADILECQVLRPEVAETTALGAAFAAGLAVGVWSDCSDLAATWSVGKEWVHNMEREKRDALLFDWKRAVQRSLGWDLEDTPDDAPPREAGQEEIGDPDPSEQGSTSSTRDADCCPRTFKCRSTPVESAFEANAVMKMLGPSPVASIAVVLASIAVVAIQAAAFLRNPGKERR